MQFKIKETANWHHVLNNIGYWLIEQPNNSLRLTTFICILRLVNVGCILKLTMFVCIFSLTQPVCSLRLEQLCLFIKAYHLCMFLHNASNQTTTNLQLDLSPISDLSSTSDLNTTLFSASVGVGVSHWSRVVLAIMKLVKFNMDRGHHLTIPTFQYINVSQTDNGNAWIVKQWLAWFGRVKIKRGAEIRTRMETRVSTNSQISTPVRVHRWQW